MTDSQSVSKRHKIDYNSCHDRLSDLPLSIIHTILSSLPIEDAVRTSILSRQWRYTWTSLPKLEFISKAEENKDEKTSSEEHLKKFISYALSVHKGSLHKFKLGGVLQEPCPNLDEWLIRLSSKDIRELNLTVEFRSLLNVHPSIYSCNKLTRLRLFFCDVGPPPPSTFTGFSFLKSITLYKVKISTARFESLVSNSPLLQRCNFYKFTRDEQDSMIRIHAPNLKCLRLRGSWTEISLNAPHLSEILVSAANKLQRGPFSKYNNFLGGCTNLKRLIGIGQFTQVMSISMESWNPNPLVLHNLRTIILNKLEFRDVKQQNVLARFLVAAPNLQHLVIAAKIHLEAQDAHFSGFAFESNFRMEKLRVVKMAGIRGLLPEIKFIEFLLERSPLLKTIRVGHLKRLDTEEIKDLTDKIVGCTRASESANILISVGTECPFLLHDMSF